MSSSQWHSIIAIFIFMATSCPVPAPLNIKSVILVDSGRHFVFSSLLHSSPSFNACIIFFPSSHPFLMPSIFPSTVTSDIARMLGSCFHAFDWFVGTNERIRVINLSLRFHNSTRGMRFHLVQLLIITTTAASTMIFICYARNA